MKIKEITEGQTPKKRTRYYEEGKKDIRYRGPLSYRAFKIFGWLCIAIGQVVVLLNLDVQLEPVMEESLRNPIAILTSISKLSVPFLLIANFSLILNASEGYHRQLIRHLLSCLGLAALAVFFYRRYVLGIGSLVFVNREETEQVIEGLFNVFSGSGYIAFNLFVDLFLCSLLMFFLNYRPKHVFTGKRLGVFRAFSLFPILYEAASIVLKFLAVEKKITLPFLVFPFLTVKPPIMFIVFLIMALFIKKRERRFIRNDRTHEDYQEFLQTNRNSLHFSGFAAVLLLIAGIVDLLLVVAFFFMMFFKDPESVKDSATILSRTSALGIGQSISLIILSPLMLLYSYNRTHKHRAFDTLIPIGGIALVILVYIEGLFRFILNIPNIISYFTNG